MAITSIVPDGRFWYGVRRYSVVIEDRTGKITVRYYPIRQARSLALLFSGINFPVGPLALSIAEICQEQGDNVEWPL